MVARTILFVKLYFVLHETFTAEHEKFVANRTLQFLSFGKHYSQNLKNMLQIGHFRATMDVSERR